MQNYKPYLLAAFALIVAFFWLRDCRRTEPVITEPAKSEADRQRVVKTDTTERAKFRKLAAERLTQIEALQRTLATETGKRLTAEKKARRSAAEYSKNPSLHTCHNALMDCQYENETKGYSLAVQERMIAEYDSLQKIQGNEINRLGMVADTLAEGWRIANMNGADLDKQLQREKRKRFGLGVSAGYGVAGTGLSPFIGVSVNYSLIRF